MEKLKPIIAEWFATLPNGYAVAPYNQDELNLLKIIITESDELDDTEKAKLTKHVDTINDVPQEEEPQPELKQDRFIAKSAPFIQSANAFIEFVKSEYTNPGVEIVGLEELFNAIVALDTDNFNSVVKLMAKHTNRQIDYGTFKMGQYELKLAELLHTHIQFDNASALNLLLAILFNGKVFAITESNLTSLAVSISGIKLIKCESQEPFVAIQPFSPQFSEIYKTVETLFTIMHSTDNADGMTTNDLSTLLASLQNGELDDDIASIIKQGATTKVPAVKLLAGKLEQMLQGKSPVTIFETFKSLYNNEIIEFTNKYQKLFDVNRDKLIIEPTTDTLKKALINSTLPAYVQLSNSQIKIDATLLNVGDQEKEEQEKI